jgi:tetratricopeptide (TPR) repeat protein
MRYPDDHEAAAFYALALQATADPNDKSYRKQLESGAILEKLYAEQRDHPGVAHYLIHAYDYPELASRALDAAHHYGEIAPTMPHALHMPSHTFIALGLWDESIRSNLAAQASARKAAWVQEELHAMDYLVYAYLQNGRTGAAAQVKDAMAAVKIEEKHSLVMDYAIAAAPARYAIERRQWLEAARLTPIPSTFAASTALTFYARALGFARGNQADEAQRNVDQLAEIHERLINSGQRYWAKQVDIQLETAMAWVAWARGKSAEALSNMHAAVALEDSTYKSPVMPAYMLPARELLGDLLLELNQPDAALAEYERSLRAVPQRFNGLYGAARAAELAGDGQKARRYYSELVRVCDQSDSQRSELEQAKRFLAGPGQRRP